jgi:hypothetical protein
VSCTLFNQQASLLQKELELDYGFHRTPLILGRLKVFYVVPCAAAIAHCHLSNEVNSLGCTAQYDWRVRADAQLRIDRKFMHGHLTAVLPPRFQCKKNLAQAAHVFAKLSRFFVELSDERRRSAAPARSACRPRHAVALVAGNAGVRRRSSRNGLTSRWAVHRGSVLSPDLLSDTGDAWPHRLRFWRLATFATTERCRRSARSPGVWVRRSQ